jgi:hypothetical protein
VVFEASTHADLRRNDENVRVGHLRHRPP